MITKPAHQLASARKNFRRSTSTIQQHPKFIACFHSESKAPCAPRPGRKPGEASKKVRLIHRLQHHQHRALQDLILERGYPQGTGFVGRARLGNMHSTHRRGHVRAGFGAVEEILKVAHQVVLVVGRRLSVHADSSVLAGLGIRHVHPIDVDVMRQRREGHLRAVPGEFRNPLLFREHGGRSRCTCHVSLQRLMRRHPLPSTGSLGMVPPLQRYSEALRLPDVPFAALRFLRLAIPSLRPWFVPHGPGRGAVDQPGVGKPVLQPPFRWRRQGLPSSRGTLVIIRHTPPTPV